MYTPNHFQFKDNAEKIAFIYEAIQALLQL